MGPSLPASGAALLQLAALTVGAVRGPVAMLGGPINRIVGSGVRTARSEPIKRAVQ